ncbi:MAG: diacylglycerol kinase family lipid kinase [Clostridia bacterium]|nr:diacylglycerol kinase family lipid kinase [Clostridia bacterium]
MRTLPKVKALLDERGIEYDVLETTYPPRREHYKAVPCRENDTVCILGGDGTVLDLMNELPGHDMRLMYVPCGTGNDFIKCVKLPNDPIKALTAQLDGTVKHIDFASANEEYFMNEFGAGFDVEVLRRLDMFKIRFSGLKAYLMAVRQAVRDYRPFVCEISVDGGAFEKKELSVLSIGNGQYIGGGMKACPNANPFDGMFELVEVKPVKKRSLMRLLPLFVLGKHIKYGLASTKACKSVTVRAKDMRYQIDGEIRKADQVTLNVISNKLRFSL